MKQLHIKYKLRLHCWKRGSIVLYNYIRAKSILSGCWRGQFLCQVALTDGMLRVQRTLGLQLHVYIPVVVLLKSRFKDSKQKPKRYAMKSFSLLLFIWSKWHTYVHQLICNPWRERQYFSRQGEKAAGACVCVHVQFWEDKLEREKGTNWMGLR